MTLITDAKGAEDIGDALSKFKVPVPNHASEITACISELYAIGSALRDIDSTLDEPEYCRSYDLIEDDLDFVRMCLRNTIGDVFRIFGDIGNGASILKNGMYRHTWDQISLFFVQTGRMTLRTRLERYKRFILELASLLKRESPRTLLLGDLRSDIQRLAPAPDRLTETLNNLSLSVKGQLSKPRSYERDRPLNSPPLQPIYREVRPLSVLEVPESPSTATQTTSESSSMDEAIEHWAMTVFQDTSTTPLTMTGEISACHGESNPEARTRLRGEFDEILEVTFGSGQTELVVRLYFRERDHRARVLCKWPRSSGDGSKYSCLPLNVLEFHRIDSSLQLCKKRPGSSKLDLWASLKFSTIERMVIFYCTLLSLRAHDVGKPVWHIQDHELASEAEVFAGQIIDDNYLHALRVYRDRDTKAVRLHATIHGGEMKRTPVWTAFITHCLVSPTWLSYVKPTMVYLRELRRHVFASDYRPQMTARGDHVLKFKSEADAKAFVRTINDLGDLVTRPPRHSHGQGLVHGPLPPPPPPMGFPGPLPPHPPPMGFL